MSENVQNKHQIATSKQINIAHLNVNSLFSKKDQISCILKDLSIHILCLNETKIDDSISNDELHIHNYTFVRKDRTRYGGGVGIYVHDNVKYKVVEILMWDALEMVWLEIILPKLEPFLLCSVYKPNQCTKI